MDLKSFSVDDFDPKKWINKAWSTSGSQEKEVFVANTVTRLQLFMKQLTNSLDETTTQIVSSVGRVVQDAAALQMEGALLQRRLEALEGGVRGVESETGQSIQGLQRTDRLKTRLENAASALREADKWAALAAALEEALDRGVPAQPEQLEQLSAHVAAMTASLEVLSEAGDYEAKRVQLETLYNRLEAGVSAPLIDAISAMDEERAARYVLVLAGMGRAPAAARCWRRAAAARLAAAWRRAERHGYSALAQLLAPEANRQVSWLSGVLQCPSPAAELARLYTDLLLSLEPDPTKVASASIKLCSTPEEGMQLLTDLRRDIDEFVASIKAVMEAPRQSAESVPAATVQELCRAAYAPLRALLPRLTALQTQTLQRQLAAAYVDQEDLLEHSRMLLRVADQCSGWLQAARAAAYRVAGRAAWPHHAPAVQSLVSTLSGHMSAHGRRIEAAFLQSRAAGGSGVLSACFPAALQLAAAGGSLLQALAAWQQPHTVAPDDCPLLDLPTLLLDAATRDQLPALTAAEPPAAAALRRARDHMRGLARAVLREPVDRQLEKIPSLGVWRDNDALSTDLPDYAIAPQEYITEIGQYLMTLPQHLEMHLTEPRAPWSFLEEVCSYTCSLYAEKILSIKNMDALGTRRAATDIAYLCSVVEDLACPVPPALAALLTTLRSAPASPASAPTSAPTSGDQPRTQPQPS